MLRASAANLRRHAKPALGRAASAAASGAGAPTRPPRPVVLTILDGWGYRETPRDNAVALADTPNFDRLYGLHSMRGQVAFLDACERDVGLPEGQIGNSEVGHMNIGAGRVVFQDICTIDDAIDDGSIETRQALQSHIEALRSSGGTCHLMGLVSPGGVHAMQSHVAALANTVAAAGVPVVIHAFTDGRDVPPNDAAQSMPEFLKLLDPGADVRVGTVTGRYFAMDRDNRWERVGRAYDVIVSGQGAHTCADAPGAVTLAHGAGVSDEFIEPTVVGDYAGMRAGDGVLMANFRADRARELLTAIADSEAPPEIWTDAAGGTDRAPQPGLADVCGMVEYSARHATYMSAIFPPKDIRNPLGEVLADAGLRQLRVAETEKYPHVTFFLNGGREEPFDGEDRILVPSPKVATYDLQPEMSAPEVGARLCEAVDSGEYDAIIVNFANPDMVGHTGSLEAAMAAVESVDRCIGDLAASVRRQGGALLLTADHGNCEKMWEESTDEPHTAHTLNKVPVILADYSSDLGSGAGAKPSSPTGVDSATDARLRSGRLADLAPTMLELLGVPKPSEMTGESLLVHPADTGSLPDGPELVRPPREGSVAAGSRR